MNDKEKAFIQSIKEKIEYYKIETTTKQAVSQAIGKFTETQYNDGRTELVDAGIEYFLCKISALYFISKYAWVDFPGIGTIPFKPYYFQEETLKILPITKRIIYLKTRQCGISTLTALYCLWRGNFKDSENIDVISTKQEKAQKFVEKINPTIKMMPEFLKTSIDRKNSSGIKWSNSSAILSETASDRAGRSDSLSLLVLDEAAHYLTDRLTRGIIAAAMPTLGRTGGSSIIISTPNQTAGAGAYYYEQVNALQISGNSNRKKLIEIDWFEVPDIPGIEPYRGYNDELQKFIDKDYFNNPIVKEQMRRQFEPITENWQQNDWLSWSHEDLGPILFKQEVLHSFVVGSDQVFSDEILEKVKNRISTFTPIWIDKINEQKINGMIVWDLPKPKHRYIIGVDVSTGTGNDFSSIEVMDVDTYEQVAEYKGKMPTKTFGKLVKKVAKFYNQAFTVIEANSIGEAVFNEVYYHDTDPYDNVYKQKKMKNGVSRMTGWETNVKTRQLMTNNIMDWFTVEDLYDKMTIKSSRLYQELTTWVWSSNRPDHIKGGHDDTLIAWGLCLYLRNKADSYGESFFIGDDGTTFEFTEKDSREISVDDDYFSFAMSNVEIDTETEKLKEMYGVKDIDQYKWLIGD